MSEPISVQKWGQVPTTDRFLAGPGLFAVHEWRELVSAAADNPVLAALVELHRPDAICYPAVVRWECRGDDFGGRESEPPFWPCSTVDIIAHYLGVELTRG